MLSGWGKYFQTGNAAGKFTKVDDSVARRLRTLMVKQRGRNLRAGQARKWTADWFHGLGLHRSRSTIRCRRRPSTGKKIIGGPCARNRKPGIERGMGETAPQGHRAPDYQ